MTFAIVVIGIIAIILHNKGYSFERMIPYLLIGGAVALIVPLGGLIALPFRIFGTVVGGVMGGVGGIIGGVFGLIGGIIGLVFGLVGIIIGGVFLVAIPLIILFAIFKVLT